MGRGTLHLAIVFAEMERDLARERTLAGLERVRATGIAPRAAQGSQPEAGRRDPEHAPARRPLLGRHRHDNRVALQQRPPDLRLLSRRDSANGLRGRITGPLGHGRIWPATRCLGNNGHRLRFKGYKLDFTHFKRHKRGNLQYDGTEWRGVPVHRSWRSIVKNPPTPTTSGYAQR